MRDVSPQHSNQPSGWVRRVAEWLGVQDGEGRLLLIAGLFQFSFVGGVAVLKAAANALLVGIESLPWLYVASAVVTGSAAAWQALRHSPRRWPPTTTLPTWMALFAALTVAAASGVPHSTEALYLAAEVYATTLSVRFWAQVGELFDLRAARRLLGLIGGVGMAGSIAGGLVTRALGPHIGALWLVPGGCLTLALCLALSPRLVPAQRRVRMLATLPSRPAEPLDVRRYLTRDGLPRTMALFVAIAAGLGAVSDFLFRQRAKELLDPGAQAALYGELSVVIGLVAMTVQLLLTGPLLRRIGLFGYLTLTPLACLLLGGVSGASAALWPVFALKAVEQVGALSLQQTGTQLLYGPMPDPARGPARSAIDGFAKKGGYALGGALLVLLATSWGAHAHPLTVPLTVAALALGALLSLVWVRTHYVRALGERLKGSAPPAHVVAVVDGSSRRVLEKALADDDERRALSALELLARDRGAKLEPLLQQALEHRSMPVRAQAARLAGERGAQTCAVRLAELARTDAPEVRELAIDAVARLRPLTAVRLLGPLLDHPDLSTRAAAIAALVPLDPSGPAGAALETLWQRRHEATEEERARIARLLGRLGSSRWSRRLEAFLTDPSPEVRRAACLAAGDSEDTGLLPHLWPMLVARDTRREARQALVRFGDRIADDIDQLLNDRSAPSDLRYRLPRVLRKIGSARALEVILFSNPNDDPFLLYRLCVEAGRIREAHPDVELDRRRAQEAALRRLQPYEALLPVASDLAAALGEQNLLVRALHDRLDQHLEAAVRLSSLLSPPRPILNAFNRFRMGDARTRPLAVELLEHVIGDAAVSRAMAGALERWHRRPEALLEGRAERAPQRLVALAQSPDVLLRALAVVTVRQLAAARRAHRTHPGTRRHGESGIHHLAFAARGASWDALLDNPPPINEEGPVSESIVEKILFLEGVEIFGDCDVDDLAAVAQHLKERTFRAGETIFYENDPGDALYVVIEGRVAVDKEGKRIMDVGARESFGETSLLDHKPRPTSARAVTDVRLLMLERTDFMDLVSDRVELLRSIFGAITKALRRVLDQVVADHLSDPALTPVQPPATERRSG